MRFIVVLLNVCVLIIFVECAFPDNLSELAEVSHHLTPKKLAVELESIEQKDCPIYAINLKPMYRDEIVSEINKLNFNNLQILEVGKVYEI